MRRGGRGFKFQASWRRLDDPTQSSIPIEQVEGLGFRRLVAFAALSIAMAILILHGRRHEHTRHDLGASKPGFLFPLYGYSYRQFQNASSTDSEGNLRNLWPGSRAAHHRALQQIDDSGPLLKLRQGYYITMKLGIPPKKFTFHVDTASRSTWVYCKTPGRPSSIHGLGPNGMYEAKRGSNMKCVGDTADLCLELQDHQENSCNRHNKYDCLLFIKYADKTTIMGVFVRDSVTLRLQDRSEVDVRAYFGCATDEKGGPSKGSIIPDGLIGLGNCMPTLAYQWFEKDIISQNVVSFCIAKALAPETGKAQPKAQIGYVSVGIDFKEKFEESSSANSAWAPLLKPAVLCAYTANLLFISFLGHVFKPQTYGVPMSFDTGSDRSYLESELYDPLLKALRNFPNSNSSQKLREQLDLYATNKGYVEVNDDPGRLANEERQCWTPPSKSRKNDKGTKLSPVYDFPWMKFSIEGEVDDSGRDVTLDLIVQPDGYLEWEEDRKRLCVNINKEIDPYPAQNFGVTTLKGHLFLLDIDNQRMRWQPDTCEMP